MRIAIERRQDARLFDELGEHSMLEQSGDFPIFHAAADLTKQGMDRYPLNLD